MQPTQTQPEGGSGQPEGFYHPVASQPALSPAPPQTQPSVQPGEPFNDDYSVQWQASEYVHHAKSPAWIGMLVVVAVALLALSVFWLRSWSFSILVVVGAIGMAVMGLRRPRVRQYSLNAQGISIDDKNYSYADFHSFSVLPDGAFYTAIIIPVKRFMPALTIYFSEDLGEKIVDILSSHLPLEDRQPDLIDNIMGKIRF